MTRLTGDDLIEDPAGTVDTCAACPRLCRDVCPTALASKDEAHTPTAKAQLMDAWQRGHIEPTADDALSLYACATCGSAKATCELEVDKEWAILAGRRASVAAGVAPGAVAELGGRYERGGQPYEEVRLRGSAAGGSEASDRRTPTPSPGGGRADRSKFGLDILYRKFTTRKPAIVVTSPAVKEPARAVQ